MGMGMRIWDTMGGGLLPGKIEGCSSASPPFSTTRFTNAVGYDGVGRSLFFLASCLFGGGLGWPGLDWTKVCSCSLAVIASGTIAEVFRRPLQPCVALCRLVSPWGVGGGGEHCRLGKGERGQRPSFHPRQSILLIHNPIRQTDRPTDRQTGRAVLLSILILVT